jgi:hypothetical protein
MIAIANASTIVILPNIIILLVAKPKLASADWIMKPGVYSTSLKVAVQLHANAQHEQIAIQIDTVPSTLFASGDQIGPAG